MVCSSRSMMVEPGGSGTRGDVGSQDVLERCLQALTHARNDSHTLAALLLITRLCPAGQLDRGTLRRILEAVGLNLPARLLVTAVRGGDGSGLPPEELLSLAVALLAALSTDADMASQPQFLSTVPLILGILPGQDEAARAPSQHAPAALQEAVAADCYQVLSAVCASPRGPEQLLTRGAVPALCRALAQNRSRSREMGLPLLGHLLSGDVRRKAWSRHPAELLDLLAGVTRDFCRAKDHRLLDLCSTLPRFLPPDGAAAEPAAFRKMGADLWGTLRPLLQSRLASAHLGRALVLSACLLDRCGWDCVGPPKFCCLLVNRACVEVRMGLEEPPGAELGPERQNTLTACYRIMEAAMERACVQGVAVGLSLQQSGQVLGVLEEAFSAVVYYLQQVSRRDDPFVYATFRCLCAWLAEETSCFKEEVTALLPFLIGYARDHRQGRRKDQDVAEWMSEEAWRSEDALRYLLPALCHLSAEEGPRRVLLALDVPGLLVDFVRCGWSRLRREGGGTATPDPGMETACSALLNFAVTEPGAVGKDACLETLETLLDEALPVLLHKPRLLVLAANLCTLGLMMGRIRAPPSGRDGVPRRRFFSAALRLLLSALRRPPGATGPLWEEAAELWRLSLQALGGCVKVQPCLVALVQDQGWLEDVLELLASSSPLPDPQSQDALEEALCAIARQSPACRQEIREHVETRMDSCLSRMVQLEKALIH
uniref:Neurochondrin n=1 Tax=Denticeps clupeoides TaxID=299321 RepID=A0AAY4CMR1_9TELE